MIATFYKVPVVCGVWCKPRSKSYWDAAKRGVFGGTKFEIEAAYLHLAIRTCLQHPTKPTAPRSTCTRTCM